MVKESGEVPAAAPKSSTANKATTTPKIKAVIFDLDGTLLDTEALSDRAVIEALGSSLSKTHRDRLDGRLPWELKSRILGLRGSEWVPVVLDYAREKWDVDAFERVRRDDDDDDENAATDYEDDVVNDLWRRWETKLNDLCEDVAACPGAPELVQSLHASGVPMAIATSSRREAVDVKRRKHEDMFSRVSVVVAGDDPEVRSGKPAPDPYLVAADRLGVDPRECLVFEDALTGVVSGRSAGCRVVAVPDPRTDDVAAFASAADVVLERLTDFDGEPWGL